MLKIANASSEMKIQPPVSHFADRVAALSKGSLVIEPVNNYADFASDAEQQVVRGVSNGRVDLGWVGTRGLDTMDVAAFEALTVPMLVDGSGGDAVVRSGVVRGDAARTRQGRRRGYSGKRAPGSGLPSTILS